MWPRFDSVWWMDEHCHACNAHVPFLSFLRWNYDLVTNRRSHLVAMVASMLLSVLSLQVSIENLRDWRSLQLFSGRCMKQAKVVERDMKSQQPQSKEPYPIEHVIFWKRESSTAKILKRAAHRLPIFTGLLSLLWALFFEPKKSPLLLGAFGKCVSFLPQWWALAKRITFDQATEIAASAGLTLTSKMRSTNLPI